MVIATTLLGLGNLDFWIGVGILAGVYGIFTLGLQLNLGITGMMNFGQAGFMAVGAYAMGVLVVKFGWSFWLALPVATGISVACGALLGLVTLRLRSDYFAIVTLAFAYIVTSVAQNARSLTGGNQGLYGYNQVWESLSGGITRGLTALGLELSPLFPLLLITWVFFGSAVVVLVRLTGSPYGRVLRSIREDEDAARSLGKNTLGYKIQSLCIAAALASVAGYLLAMDLGVLAADQFRASFTFIGYAGLILGGLASYRGVVVGSILMWTILEGTRFVSLPIADYQVASLRFIIVGVILMLLMAFRPEGLFGKRDEMMLDD